MASQHYGPALYPSQTSHASNIYSVTPTHTRVSMSSVTPNVYPPADGSRMATAANMHRQTHHDDQPLKRRRTDGGPAISKFVPQTKWTFAESQPWMEVHPSSATATTTSSSKTSTNTASATDGVPLPPQQLPTPQTPRFPSKPYLHTGNATMQSTAPVQPTHVTGGVMGHQTSHAYDLESVYTVQRRPSHAQQVASEQQARRGARDREPSLADATPSSPSLTHETLSPSPHAKPKQVPQTLSLEKDREQIAALIAAKRRENEASMFRQRLVQKQIEHQNSKGSSAASSHTDALGLMSPPMPTMQPVTPTLRPDQLVPPPSSNTSPGHRGTHPPRAVPTQATSVAASKQSMLYAPQPLPALPHPRPPPPPPPLRMGSDHEPSSHAVIEQPKRSRAKPSLPNHVANTTSVYSSAFVPTSREPELRTSSMAHNSSPNSRLDKKAKTTTTANGRPSLRVTAQHYMSGDNNSQRSTSSSNLGNPSAPPNRRKTWTTNFELAESATRVDSSNGWHTPKDYSYEPISARVPHISNDSEVNFQSQQDSHATPRSALPSSAAMTRAQSQQALASTHSQIDNHTYQQQPPKFIESMVTPTVDHTSSAPQRATRYYNVDPAYFFSPTTTAGSLLQQAAASGLEALAQTAASSAPANVATRPQKVQGVVSKTPTASHNRDMYTAAGTGDSRAWSATFKQPPWDYYASNSSGPR